jgi:hypothetical protein
MDCTYADTPLNIDSLKRRLQYHRMAPSCTQSSHNYSLSGKLMFITLSGTQAFTERLPKSHSGYIQRLFTPVQDCL